MKELFTEAILPYNLPFTLLLVVLCGYWALSLIGVLDMDGVSLDAEMDVDSGLDMGGDVDVEGAADPHGGDGIPAVFLRLVNASDIPIMLIASLLLVSMWTISMISNQLWNPDHSILRALMFLVGNFVVSILFIKIVTAPLRPFFRKLKTDPDREAPAVGREGVVKTNQLTDTFGQVEITDAAVPIVINARIRPGEPALDRGTHVIIFDHDKSLDIYRVRPISST